MLLTFLEEYVTLLVSSVRSSFHLKLVAMKTNLRKFRIFLGIVLILSNTITAFVVSTGINWQYTTSPGNPFKGLEILDLAFLFLMVMLAIVFVYIIISNHTEEVKHSSGDPDTGSTRTYYYLSFGFNPVTGKLDPKETKVRKKDMVKF